MSDSDFPEVPDEDDLEARLKEHRKRVDAAQSKNDKSTVSGGIDQETSRGVGIGLTAAYAIIGLPLVGAGLGWLLDRALHTGFCVAIGAVAGLIGGMWNAVQLSNRS